MILRFRSCSCLQATQTLVEWAVVAFRGFHTTLHSPAQNRSHNHSILMPATPHSSINSSSYNSNSSRSKSRNCLHSLLMLRFLKASPMPGSTSTPPRPQPQDQQPQPKPQLSTQLQHLLNCSLRRPPRFTSGADTHGSSGSNDSAPQMKERSTNSSNNEQSNRSSDRPSSNSRRNFRINSRRSSRNSRKKSNAS